ncbi:hypothetical protein [Ruegeria sp. AU67]|uniref:hypothetical protein n=1 Tax=Ruegeria sp. AU67 TaxID=2108530 RepID=UPI000D69BE65|nr:hypothetical protein [Ruegeria sp. AU67]
MTDAPPTNTALPATWQDALHTGDVVAFRFPHETDGPNLPKVRPALVLDVEETDVGRFASLAYGTSNPRSRKAAYCVDVRSEKDRATAALHLPTRFDASRRILVSLDHPGSSCTQRKGRRCSDASPVLQSPECTRCGPAFTPNAISGAIIWADSGVRPVAAGLSL